MQAADECHISIPDDISLLGFDNIIYSSLPRSPCPPWISASRCLQQAAVNLLTDIIDSSERDEFTHRLIRPTLITRSSCRETGTVSKTL